MENIESISDLSLIVYKCFFEHNPERNYAIHEEYDSMKFKPDGIRIKSVKSAYCNLNFNTEIIEKPIVKKSNRGRKPIVKEKKNIRNTTNNNEFYSSITFKVIDPDDPENIYSLRLFRVNNINISNMKTLNPEKVKIIVQLLFDYINETDSGIKIKIKGEPEIISFNYIMNYEIPFTNYIFNLTLLKSLINKDYNNADYWGYNFTKLIVQIISTHIKLSIGFDKKPLTIKIFNNGKINIFGLNNLEFAKDIARKIYNIIADNHETITQYGYKARKKNEIIY